MKTVTEQRGHVCPLPHRADVMFSSGTASPHAGQPSVSIRDILSWLEVEANEGSAV